MEKKYTFNDEDKEDNVVREPMTGYGIYQDEKADVFYDIPNEYLAQRIERAEKDIAEGNVIPLEEAIRRILK